MTDNYRHPSYRKATKRRPGSVQGRRERFLLSIWDSSRAAKNGLAGSIMNANGKPLNVQDGPMDRNFV